MLENKKYIYAKPYMGVRGLGGGFPPPQAVRKKVEGRGGGGIFRKQGLFGIFGISRLF